MNPHRNPGRQRRLPAVLAAFAAVAAAPAATQPPLDAAEALRALQAGNGRFARGESLAKPLGEGVRRTLARGQSPIAVVVCGVDSRVVPEHLFNAGLGELWVVRVADHVCDPAALASIEYAAEHLRVPLCVVLGDDAAEVLGRSDLPETPAMASVLARVSAAAQRARRDGLTGADLDRRAAEEHVYETVAEILRRSPALRELVLVGQMQVAPARYSLTEGTVEWLPQRPLAELTARRAQVDVHRPRVQPVPPHVALTLLTAGHRRFVSENRATADLSAARREALTQAQRPFAVVLTTPDSRVAPEHLFDCGLGELAVVRVLGLTLDDEVVASVEYATQQLGAGLVLVLTPDDPGPVDTLLRPGSTARLSPSLRAVADWLAPSLAAARQSAPRSGQSAAAVDPQRVLELNAQRVARELLVRSPLLRRLEGQGQLGVLAAKYRLASGELDWLRSAPEPEAAAPAADAGQPPAPGEDVPAAPAAEMHGQLEPQPEAPPHHAPHAAGAHEGHDHGHAAAGTAAAAGEQHQHGAAHAPEHPRPGTAKVEGGAVSSAEQSRTVALGLLVAIAGVLLLYMLLQSRRTPAAPAA